MIDKTRKPLTTRAWLTRLSPAPGLVTAPIPITTTSYEPSSTTDLEIKQQAAAVERLYADNSVTLSPTCELAKLIGMASTPSNLFTEVEYCKALQLSRIVKVFPILKDFSGRIGYLQRMARGSLDPFSRKISDAKNLLWELEYCGGLHERSVEAKLAEPDIVAEIDGESIGFACKTLYSEKNGHSVLKKAVEQVERRFDFGIVALNIEQLTRSPIREASYAAAMTALFHENRTFMNNNYRSFDRYLASARVLEVCVSSGGPFRPLGVAGARLEYWQKQTFVKARNGSLAKDMLMTRLARQLTGQSVLHA